MRGKTYLQIFLLVILLAFLMKATPKFEPKIKKNYKHQKVTNIIFHGSRNENKIALTFDADMTPGMKRQLEQGRVKSWYNREVIDILKKTNTKATLFLTGMWVELYPNVTKEFAVNPLFEIANHSYSHPSFHGFCYDLFVTGEINKPDEILKTQKVIEKITGITPKYFRFPGGCYGNSDLDLVKKYGLITVQWDVAGDDGFNFNSTSIYNRIVNQTRNGSIIVLHLHGGPNAPATAVKLEDIIKELKNKGFEFVKMSELNL